MFVCEKAVELEPENRKNLLARGFARGIIDGKSNEAGDDFQAFMDSKECPEEQKAHWRDVVYAIMDERDVPSAYDDTNEADSGFWDRFLDRVSGRIEDFLKPGTDGLKDHSMIRYVEHIENALTSGA